MNLNKHLQINWDEETGTSTCVFIDSKNNKHIGIAICHPDDKDMKSEKTGLNRAQMRAMIKYYQHIKNNELRPQLKILQHLESLYRNCDQNNYENKTLRKQIYLIKNDLDVINENISILKKELKNYINSKESFYKSVRKHRGQKESIYNEEISN